MVKLNERKTKLKRLIFIIIFVIIIILLIIFVLQKVFVIDKEEKNNSTNEILNNTIDIKNEEKVEEIIYVPIQEQENKKQEEQKQENQEQEDQKQEQPIQEPSNTTNNIDRTFGNNIAFIGDSRTQAFLMYTGLKDVKNYTNIGLMVDTAVTKKFITNNKGKKITILEDLENQNVDTVYIMLGINELGWVYSSIFIKDYEELIDKIKVVKPNCEIIVQSIIPVTKSKSDSDNVYNNKRISEYNSLINQMAIRKNIQYIDLVPNLADKNGNLPEDASPDGIHLNKEYSLKWLECLKNN